VGCGDTCNQVKRSEIQIPIRRKNDRQEREICNNGFRIYATQPLDSDLLNPKVKYSMSHLQLTVPTNKSKVLAYLPKQTYERLVLFQRDHGLSLSQAVTLVMKTTLGYVLSH